MYQPDLRYFVFFVVISKGYSDWYDEKPLFGIKIFKFDLKAVGAVLVNLLISNN